MIYYLGICCSRWFSRPFPKIFRFISSNENIANNVDIWSMLRKAPNGHHKHGTVCISSGLNLALIPRKKVGHCVCYAGIETFL